jgi:hypothetical protein
VRKLLFVLFLFVISSCGRFSLNVTKRKYRPGYFIESSLQHNLRSIPELGKDITEHSAIKKVSKQIDTSAIQNEDNIYDENILWASSLNKNEDLHHLDEKLRQKSKLNLAEKAIIQAAIDTSNNKFCTSAFISIGCGIAAPFSIIESLSILGLLCIPAIVFGIIALGRISNRKNLKGSGFAIVGITLGGLYIIVLLFLVLYVLLALGAM